MPLTSQKFKVQLVFSCCGCHILNGKWCQTQINSSTKHSFQIARLVLPPSCAFCTTISIWSLYLVWYHSDDPSKIAVGTTHPMSAVFGFHDKFWFPFLWFWKLCCDQRRSVLCLSCSQAKAQPQNKLAKHEWPVQFKCGMFGALLRLPSCGACWAWPPEASGGTPQSTPPNQKMPTANFPTCNCKN